MGHVFRSAAPRASATSGVFADRPCFELEIGSQASTGGVRGRVTPSVPPEGCNALHSKDQRVIVEFDVMVRKAAGRLNFRSVGDMS